MNGKGEIDWELILRSTSFHQLPKINSIKEWSAANAGAERINWNDLRHAVAGNEWNVIDWKKLMKLIYWKQLMEWMFAGSRAGAPLIVSIIQFFHSFVNYITLAR